MYRINYKLQSIKRAFFSLLSLSVCFWNWTLTLNRQIPNRYSGIYKVYINDKHINTYNHTGLFGELALLYNMPRYVMRTSPHDTWYLIDSLCQIFRGVWATITTC